MKQPRRTPQAVIAANSHSLGPCFAVIVVACCFASGCVKPEQPVHEQPPSPQTPQAAEPAQPQQMPKLPPPRLGEVQAAVNRVFKDAAFIDTGRQPHFIDGDFNGDLSPDIAVVVRPVPFKLPQMNEEFPPWMLKDPFEANRPATQQLRVEANDVLLAVLHGHGPNGWRDPQATQTYLLKNAVGSDLQTHPGKEFVAANRGRKLPRLQGDLIGEVLQGTPGYLYYTGPTYSWYNPKTFSGEPERRMVHGGATAGTPK